jgi:hypothetical protein
VGDRSAFDVVGTRRAGFAKTVIIEENSMFREDQSALLFKPDAWIHELSELIFLPR